VESPLGEVQGIFNECTGGQNHSFGPKEFLGLSQIRVNLELSAAACPGVQETMSTLQSRRHPELSESQMFSGSNSSEFFFNFIFFLQSFICLSVQLQTYHRMQIPVLPK
jgi:hypothetical protein